MTKGPRNLIFIESILTCDRAGIFISWQGHEDGVTCQAPGVILFAKTMEICWRQ